jgi:glycosyltransferase involved in cell wall biosynthesis
MRILLVHEYYRERGGEDVAFEADADLLTAAGHDVETLTFNNTEIPDSPSIRERIELFASTIWSREAAARVARKIGETGAEVVHFHNTFPLASPAVLAVASKIRVPTVMTLHNYRLICPSATLFREGKVCEDCVSSFLPFPAVMHSCYRGSRLQSAAVATMSTIHKVLHTWERNVDLFITPSEFLRQSLVRSGMPESRIEVRSNAVPHPSALEAERGDDFLFVGRLVDYKGVAALLNAWEGRPDLPHLRIVGGGEMEHLVREAAAANSNIDYLGEMSHDDVYREMRKARALVVPSIWYETQGLTILEAFACGLPVIGSRIGAIPEAVIDGQTGLLFEPDAHQELVARVEWALGHRAEMEAMGAEAEALFHRRYSPEASISRLLALYDQVLNGGRSGSALVAANSSK